MVWKMVESQGKVSEKSGNFEMDSEWQPCDCFHKLTKSIDDTCNDATMIFASINCASFDDVSKIISQVSWKEK